MKKTNIDWSFVELEVRKRKSKTTFNKPITKTIVWKSCFFVGKVERCPWRIVLFTWVVIKDLWENVECEMIDNHIHAPKTLFKIILPKRSIKQNNYV